MPIPIPSNIPVNPTVDFHRNDLITPPSAPAVVESLAAIDPRVALNMPLPVADSSAGGSLQDAIQNPANNAASSSVVPSEPTVDQAVFLEISSMAGNQAEIAGESQLSNVNNLLSQSLSRLDSAGSAALGQLLSDILAVDVPELGQLVQPNKTSQAQNVVVNWPLLGNLQSSTALTNNGDPRVAMKVLYEGLQNSGIFAADQLKKLLFSSGGDGEVNTSSAVDVQKEVGKLLSHLNDNSPALQDSVKLLLRGDLLWQGQFTPNIQGKIYREDAWGADPKNPAQLQKGSRITLEVTLPNLGPLKVVGTQFGESVHVFIEPSPGTQSVFSSSFSDLLDQMRTQIDPDAKVSLRNEEKTSG
jgi:hypothetical protein